MNDSDAYCDYTNTSGIALKKMSNRSLNSEDRRGGSLEEEDKRQRRVEKTQMRR